VDSPESPYAASKVAGEALARTFHNLYGIEVATLRFFTVYGPRQRPDLAIHKFSRRMIAGQPLPFFGDGSTRRDYTWVDDIIAGVLAACDVSLRHDVLNLGAAHTTSLAELVALLEEVLGVRAVLDRQPAQPGDVPLTSADVTHARAILGYVPRTPIGAGLEKFAEWIRGEGQNWV
jgi:UDP-glucuronate 4-epimerase